MENKLQKGISNLYVLILSVIVVLSSLSNANAQCATKITDTDNDGKDYVCASSISSYTAVRPANSTGSVLSWALCCGGTIVSTTDDGVTSTVNVQWSNASGSGPYCLTLTETDDANDCTGSDKINVYIEKNNLNMACNDLVLVALDNNCQSLITADMVIESPLYPNDSYQVTVFNSNNTPRANPRVTMPDLGDTLMVTVKHLCSGLTCMGNIAMQDKLATMLTCRHDTIKVNCDQNTNPENTLVGFPLPSGSTVVKKDEGIYTATIPGDCGGKFTLVYTDNEYPLACGKQYSLVINRTWSAIDASGNSWSCTEVIAKKWADFSTLKMPCNWDGLNGHKFFQCYDQNATNSKYWPYRDSIPGPAITGFPEFITCSNIQYLYEDHIAPGCGYNKKVIREWIVLDWCTGKTKICDQVLAFVDDQPPIFYLPKDTLIFNSNAEDCFGTAYPLPLPTVAYECSGWNYQVLGYILNGTGFCSELNALHDNLYKNNGYYGIKDLPVGVPTCVVYKVTDSCGYSSFGNVLIMIKDNQPPTASCEGHTVVTLSDYGELTAISLDDKSWDNCGIKSMKIKRSTNRCGYPSDLNYSDFVHLCCDDVNKEVIVSLQVIDLSGNISTCTANVIVKDIKGPTITYCPPGFNVNCDQSYANIFVGGKPTATDFCDNITMTYVDSPNLNNCGIGTVTRVWTIKDGSGNESTGKCIQTINVIDSKPLKDTDITWPANITVNGCYPNVDIDESITGIPHVNNPLCKKIGIAHTDQIVSDPQDANACVQILRKFKVGDWCNETAPLIEHVQVISIGNGNKPTFVSCPSDTVVYTGTACEAKVTLTANATDDCTPASRLKYSYKVDRGNNGTIDLSGLGNSVSLTLERGLNKISFTVVDDCGNETTCDRIVRVVDQKPPTPVCLLKLTTSLGENGKVSIYAKTFNRASFDNCTPSNYGPCECKTDLRFSFSNSLSDSIRTYTCDSLNNGVGKTFNLNVYAWDLDNNKDYCKVTLNVTDTRNVCPDTPIPFVRVNGNVSDYTKNGLEDFNVYGIKNDLTNQSMVNTDAEGNYSLTSLNAYGEYRIVVDKEDKLLDGLTTLDLVLIQKHLLNISQFDSPYKYIAADANESNSVTASDIMELRRVILGVNDELSSQKTWRFLRADTEFNSTSNPFDFQNYYLTDSLYFDHDSLDFIGVKIGDVNRSASAYSPSTSGIKYRNDQVSYFKVSDSKFEAGQNLNLNFSPVENMKTSGFQYTLKYDASKLQFVDIENKAIELTNNNVNTNKTEDGIITVSWNNGNGVEIKPESPLFTFKFKALSEGNLSSSLDINSDLTTAEIYNDKLETSDLKLRFDNQIISVFNVFQNTPNPFSDLTQISFYLPSEGKVDMRIFDSTGKTILTKTGHYSKGINNITLTKSQIMTPGVYYYELKNDNNTILKKMVKIN